VEADPVREAKRVWAKGRKAIREHKRRLNDKIVYGKDQAEKEYAAKVLRELDRLGDPGYDGPENARDLF